MSKAHLPWIVAGLAVASVLLVLSLRVYARVESSVTEGQLRLRPEAPAAATVWLGPVPRWIKLSHAYGSGVVNVRLVDDSGAEMPIPVDLRLTSSDQFFESADFDVSGQPAGNFRLEARLREGHGGTVSYTALAQGGAGGQPAAAAVGLAAGAAAALAIVLVFELAISFSLTEDTMQDE